MAFEPNNPNGQALSANSQPVVLSAEQEALLGVTAVATEAVQTATEAMQLEQAAQSALLSQTAGYAQDAANALGTPADAAAATDTSTASSISLFKRIAQRLTSILTALGTPMQQTGGTVTANAGTNLNTSALALESTQSAANGSLTNILTQLGTMNGSQSTSAAQTTGNNSLASIDGRIGSVTETAPASDTASSGLNGRLQRIAQRITTLVTDFTAGSYKIIIKGGAKGSTAAGEITSTNASADRQPMDVILRDATGAYVAAGGGGGGGTEYNDGDSPVPVRGTAAMAMVREALVNLTDEDINSLLLNREGRLYVSKDVSYLNKTYTNIVAMQNIAASTVVISSVVSVTTLHSVNVYIRFGRRVATASTAGVNFRIEGSPLTSGNDTWSPLVGSITTNFAACEAEAVTGTVNAGTNVVTVASTTNLAIGDVVFINNTTAANSEFGRVKSIVTNTSITLEDNLTNAQTGSTIYDSAEIFPSFKVDLSGCLRLRVVIDGASFTQNFAAKIDVVTLDSIS